MRVFSDAQRSIPTWLQAILDEEGSEDRTGKRHEARIHASGLAKVTHIGERSITPIPVRLYNAGAHSVGFTARYEFNPGDELTLLPHDAPEIVAPELAVRLQIVHCTQTVQGYKIGCKFST